MKKVSAEAQEFTWNELSELQAWAAQTRSSLLLPGTIVLLKGPMGIGKTQLVRLWMAELATTSANPTSGPGVSSPTFALFNWYPTSPPVVHADLYRLSSAEDLESTGFWDLFAQTHSVVIIEWAERVDLRDLPLGWSIWQLELQFAGTARRAQLRHLQAPH